MPFDVLHAREDAPDEGKMIVYWLGGAGFVFKFHSGEIICVDPYLSDAVERLYGFKRLCLAPIRPDQMAIDLLLLTHDHTDHLDIDSFDALVTSNPHCRILAAASCTEFLDSKGVAYEMASPDSELQFKNIHITPIKADHGELCRDAVGFLLSFAGRKLYFTGDTCLNLSAIATAIQTRPEIVVACINGAYGNLNELEAAKLVKLCDAKIAIPSHFWLFAEHGGCPELFMNHIQTESANTEVVLLTPGRGIEL